MAGRQSIMKAEKVARRGAVCLLLLGALIGSGLFIGGHSAEAAVYLPQVAPDWNQPYRYAAPLGPGPGPGPKGAA